MIAIVLESTKFFLKKISPEKGGDLNDKGGVSSQYREGG